MPGPEVVVKTTETPQSAGVSQTPGTAFIVAGANYGPETPTLVRSLSEGQALYGPREGESTKLYDALNTFFVLGGQRAYVNRTAGEGSPKAATKELESAGAKKVLIVEAKYKGEYGNKLKIQVVENGAKTKSKLVIFNPEGEVLEESPEETEAKELFEWGEKHTAFVIIKEGSEFAAGKAEKVKELAKTVLTGGANPTNNEKSTVKSIEGLPRSLGPGQLICPGQTEEKVHIAMGEHCTITMKNLRVAICDLKEAEKKEVTVATLAAEKGTYTTAVAQSLLFTASTCVVQGTTLGTTRTIPSSSVVAGLCAQASKTLNNATAPAGRNFSLAPYVLSFTNTFSQTQTNELSEKGINTFAERQGVPCLFGFVSAVPQEKDLIFWQFSSSRERMALVSAAEIIGETYLFKNIDGRKRLISRFQAELQGVVKNHWENNALFGVYGVPGEEPGIVNVGEPINTLTTIQNGELNAEMIVRIAPFAQLVTIIITTVPLTETV